MNTYTYDAFISYRHMERDAAVAEALHKKLEHYHIPGAIAKETGLKNFRRVFRDREELPLSADLTENIYEALKASRFLIVICSPESLQSQWVQREVDFFVKLHGRERVLTVLADGEPEEAFPPILCERTRTQTLENGETVTFTEPVEPLAADIRGKNDKERKRKLDREFLRLVAAMLDKPYDSLKQRHREYRMRRVLGAVSALLCLTAAFLIYAWRQNTEINRQYQEVRRNQARLLADQANTLMDQGDRIGSLRTVMEITPEDEMSDEPVVPEQMYPLNQALYSYEGTGIYLETKPYVIRQLDGALSDTGRTGRETMVCGMSTDTTIFFAVDAYGKVYFYDVASRKKIWETEAASYGVDVEERGEEAEAFLCGKFLTENRIALFTRYYLCILDLETRQCVKKFRSEDWQSFSILETVAVSPDGRYLALPDKDGETVLLYDCEEEGETEPRKLVYMTDDFDYTISALAFSGDGEKLAVGNSLLSELFDGEKKQKITVFQLNTGEAFSYDSENVSDLKFVDEEKLASIQYEVLNTYETVGMYLHREYLAQIYDLEAKKSIWESVKRTEISYGSRISTGIETQDHLRETAKEDIAAFYMGGTVIAVSRKSWTAIHQNNFDGTIQSLCLTDQGDHGFAALRDGSVYLWSSGLYSKIFSIDQDVRAFYCSGQQPFTMIQAVNSSTDLIFSGIGIDDSMIDMGDEIPEFDQRKDHEEDHDSTVIAVGAETGRIVSGLDKVVTVEDPSTGKEIQSIRLESENYHYVFAFLDHDTKLMAYADYGEFFIWDLETGERVTRQSVKLRYPFKNEILVDPKGEFVALNSRHTFSASDSTGAEFPELELFYVTEDWELIHYASVLYGEVNFEKREIYCTRTNGDETHYYRAPFYTYGDLRERAEKTLKAFED